MINHKPLLAFYGDDFTGSTDAMEALAKNGYRTVLFLEPPSSQLLSTFSGIQCIGVAGTSRAKSPEHMEKELRPIMNELAQSGARIVHYKTCSTFDSSPNVGSIGKAIQVSRNYFSKQKTIPLLVGAPALGRFTLFGHHFAKSGSDIYRLDRHPIMSRHPVTPMDESDLLEHLRKQLDEDMGLMNILELEGNYETVIDKYKGKLSEYDVLLMDVLDEERLNTSGRLMWESSENQSQFVVGSSGVEYALTSHWEHIGIQKNGKSIIERQIEKRENILVISGSASSTTKEQIENAIAQGFFGIRIPPEILVGSDSVPKEFLKEAVARLANKQSVILYSALGPDDEFIQLTRNLLEEKGMSSMDSSSYIGSQLGKWAKYLMIDADIKRVVIAGGDTSGFVTSEMNVYGLEMIQSISPGAPLCRVYSEEFFMKDVELALKGGQFGGPNYFGDVLYATTV